MLLHPNTYTVLLVLELAYKIKERERVAVVVPYGREGDKPV